MCPNIWAHPTCHPKAHRLSKKCMNNLGAGFGRDPQKIGRTLFCGKKLCAQIVGGPKIVRPNYSCIFTTNGEPWFGMLDIWAHPTCHPKAHRLSKKCMNNLGARFGRDFWRTIWAHQHGPSTTYFGRIQHATPRLTVCRKNA